ncbi:MAG TPA: GrdX family protein [Halanaerobiales bacterium]|nr:GrdX family protein [Halanaerobiales bacterium]
MSKYILITNNPKVKNKYEEKNIKISFMDNIESIFKEVRDYIHQGYILISHPLAGSVKPFQNPYRSIILRGNKGLDFDSLKTYENSYEKYQQFKEKKKSKSELPADILDDYQVIDLSLIESAIQSIKLD